MKTPGGHATGSNFAFIYFLWNKEIYIFSIRALRRNVNDYPFWNKYLSIFNLTYSITNYNLGKSFTKIGKQVQLTQDGQGWSVLNLLPPFDMETF